MELTNGPLGLPGIPAPSLGPWSLRSKPAYYYLVLTALALAYVVCHRLVHSRIGRAFLALRENEALAESVGIRSEEHTSELQSRPHLVCRLLLGKKKK